MELNVTDVASLYYHGIHNLVEAYKIFYGEMPDLETMEDEIESRKKFQLMTIILGEYNVLNSKYSDYRYIGYNDELKQPYSTKVDSMFGRLIEIMRKVNNKSFELEQLCENRPLPENEKEGIKAISYVIKKQMEKEKTEEPIEFLKQLCNVLYTRDSLIFHNDTKFEDMVNEIVKAIAQKYDYSKEMVTEKINFISRELCLYIDRRYENCSLNRIVMGATQNGSDYDSYLGLLPNEESFEKQRTIRMNNSN